nr:hypothetical protein Iba_chr05cCG11860 [Ipomoea batatas]
MHASDVCFPFAATPEEWKRSRVKKLLIRSKPPQGLVPAMRCPWSQKLAQLSTAAIVYKPSPPSPVLSTCIVVFRWGNKLMIGCDFKIHGRWWRGWTRGGRPWFMNKAPVHHLQQSFFVVRPPEEKVAIVDLLLSPSSFCLVCDFFAGGGRERGVVAAVVKTMVIIVVEWDGGDAAAGGGEVGGLRGSGVGGEKTKVESMVAAAVCDVVQVAVSLALMVVTKVVAATLEADVVVKSPVMAGSSSFRPASRKRRGNKANRSSRACFRHLLSLCCHAGGVEKIASEEVAHPLKAAARIGSSGARSLVAETSPALDRRHHL